MLYALLGIDYWQSYSKDPYDINVRFVNDPKHSRTIVKNLILLGINANDEKSLYKAFRNEEQHIREGTFPNLIHPTHQEIHLQVAFGKQG